MHALLALLPLVVGASALADTQYGEFQRAIEHDRAFQREMDAQRAATDAINKPSTFKAPPSQAISAQAWLGALAEQKKAAAEANLARLRNVEANRLRAIEAEAAAQKAQQQRDAMANAEREQAAAPLIAVGIPETEADVGRYLRRYNSGKYHIDSTPEMREGIVNAVNAKTVFDTRFGRSNDYAEMSAWATCMETGFDDGTPSKFYFAFLPLSSFRARVRLMDYFKTEQATNDLLAACEKWPQSGRFVGLSEAERFEVLSTWARVAISAGRGERELARRIADPKEFYVNRHPELGAPLHEAAYRRSMTVLSTGKLDNKTRLAEGEGALSDIDFLIVEEAAKQNWSAVLEWHIRKFELPGLRLNVDAQAAFGALLDERPALLNELTSVQWTRLAAVRELAVPVLLNELPKHLDPATQANLVRNVRISRAAQADDRVTALAIAYECRGVSDGVRTDPVGLARALFVATAALPAGASAEQATAMHRARALEAFLSMSMSTENRLLAVQEGVAAGVRESVFVSAMMQLRQKPDSAQRVQLRKTLEQLRVGGAFWSGQVFASSVSNLMGLSWLEDAGVSDGRARALAVWRAAAEAGDVSCMTALGVTLTDGKSVKADWDEGKPWLERAAAAGSPSACAHQGILLFLGRAGYAADPAAAVPLLRRGMVVDRAGVPYCLGLAAARGVGGVEKDPVDALRFWQAVQGQGSFRVDAALEMAEAYFRGRGAPQDGPKAIATIRPFAEAGNARAQNSLATLISKKAAPDIAPEEAFPWWRKAAVQGLFVAARNLYACQVRGSPGVQDPEKALLELETFLESGSAAARYQGGLLLLNEGEMSFPENAPRPEEGRRWITRAAEGGYAPAQSWLKSHAPNA